MFDILRSIGVTARSVTYVTENGTTNEDDGLVFLKQQGVTTTGSIIVFDNHLNTYYFSPIDDRLIISQSLSVILNYRVAHDHDNYIDSNMLNAYKDSGLVLPPYTIYQSVYQIPVYSQLSVSNENVSLVYRGIDVEGVEPFRGSDDLFNELQSSIKCGLPSDYKDIYCTISGGADSAALLSVLQSMFDSDVIKGICCRMPGMASEVGRAKKVGSQFGVFVEEFIPDRIEADKAVKKYVASFSNVMFDPVVPVITAMFNECIGDRSKGGKVVVFEGQGADTVLVGLPHNTAIELYKWPLFPVFWFTGLFLPAPNEWLRRNFRSIYRLIKVVRMLGQSNWRRALLKSLDFEYNTNSDYFVSLESMLDSMFKISGDRHKAIMLFFLLILQSREMQKYNQVPNGVAVALPFLEINFIKRCYVTPTAFFFRNGRRKIPVMERVRKFFPGLFVSEGTTPFAVEYQFPDLTDDDLEGYGNGTFGQLKKHSVRELRKLYNIGET